jgi:uncharacterized protein YcbX
VVQAVEVRVAQLWRYPVKSMQGERLDAADVLGDGVAFDRAWGIRSDATGHILTGRRRPELLLASATVVDDQPLIELPDGAELHGTGPDIDAALSIWLGEAVRLVEAALEPPSLGQFYADPVDDSSAIIEWTMPNGRFVDALPILVLTTSSLHAGAAVHRSGDWDPRRFRANVLVDTEDDGWIEDDWLGKDVHAGAITIVPRARCERCTMVIRRQPGLERDADVFKSLLHHHGGTMGVWSTVGTAGSVSVGDRVTVT